MQLRILSVLLLVAALAGCGGGGGGSGSSSSSSSSAGGGGGSPTVTFTVPSAIVQSADAGTGQNPLYDFDVTLSAPLPAGTHAGYAFTDRGVAHVAFFFRTDTEYHGIIYFEDPTEIGPGVYNDSVIVGLCSDEPCSSLRPGTTRTIPITYTITGTVPPPVSASASIDHIDREVMAFTNELPVLYIDLAYQNVRANNSLDITPTANYTAVGGVLYERISETQGRVRVQLKNSSTIAAGVYDDVITIRVCQGNKCPTNVVGSPIAINVHYVVNDTATGPNGYTVRTVQQSAVHSAWDPAGARLYLVTPPTAAQNPNSLVALDPVSRTLGPSVVVGNFPVFVATSEDGQFAYVASRDSNPVKRFALPALTLERTIPMGSDADGPLAAQYLAVAPGQPHTIAAVLIQPYPSGVRRGVAVFDDETMRTHALLDSHSSLYSLQWNGTTSLYAANTGTSPQLTTLPVDASGVSAGATQNVSSNVQASGVFFQLDAGQIYFDRAVHFDPSSGNVDTFEGFGVQEPHTPRIAGFSSDSAHNRAIALVQNEFDYSLQSFDLTTRQKIATIPLNGISFNGNTTTRITRWGANGIALLSDDGRVVLVHGPFIAP